jgi:sulfite exporter TauE/SafE
LFFIFFFFSFPSSAICASAILTQKASSSSSSPSRFKHVFWLDASRTATIEQSYMAIGATIRGLRHGRIASDAARGLPVSPTE